MPNPASLDARATLSGILPPVTMPFDSRGRVELSALKEQIDFMIANGVGGVVVGGSTGEGHTLERTEFAAVMRAAHDATAGRVPFLAGLIVNSTQEAIDRIHMLEGMNIAATQITPVHYLFKPDAEGTVQHFRTVYDETGIPILIYNVIPWNYLSSDLMLRIMREVPGVVGMKQSSGDLKSVSDLLLGAGPGNVVLSGIDALLYPSFALGAHGAITALTAAVPGVCVKLWDAVRRGDHATALDIHKRLNALWNSLYHDNLPACVKYIQHRQGLGFFHPRAPMQPVSDAQKAGIDKAMLDLPL
ncbi:dihydrodipicolinate synthase family protein [Azospirillum sp. RWY-5-1]|uniref:Dihydrodipicolinate synthase family protein n=1 Tax=Azospirillum oleiclasticum TaxID=2735135 RepID=A0ABX2TDT9_9PROT|nr:dihydrodipicolinate synthase family protein [Azospirillum oleiclasticum]NYZ13947.1 dihydrodipicolinate synthase family protein [Azospirillum oleiclasticum]NYZ20870.1 dihydrodipicolinate synthase family protein [Azospirillum oleiclasticum]